MIYLCAHCIDFNHCFVWAKIIDYTGLEHAVGIMFKTIRLNSQFSDINNNNIYL